MFHPAAGVMHHARHHQRQQAGPQQRDVGVVVGPRRQHSDQFGVGLPFDPGNGLATCRCSYSLNKAMVSTACSGLPSPAARCTAAAEAAAATAKASAAPAAAETAAGQAAENTDYCAGATAPTPAPATPAEHHRTPPGSAARTAMPEWRVLGSATGSSRGLLIPRPSRSYIGTL